MSNGTIPLSGTNLTHPSSGNTVILRDVKGAIKSCMVLGLREAFKYSAYDNFKNIKITTEYPIKSTDYPCIVVLLQNLSVKQTGVDKRTRHLQILTPEGIRILREERRSFTASMGIYHAAYNTAEMALLSDAILDILTFDSGRYLERFVNANVPGIAYMTDNITFSGEMQELAPEGERYIYSDIISIPIYGEVVMNAWQSVVTDVEIAYAIVGGDSNIIIQDYPEGWDW